jgi:hypothetical protein
MCGKARCCSWLRIRKRVECDIIWYPFFNSLIRTLRSLFLATCIAVIKCWILIKQ